MAEINHGYEDFEPTVEWLQDDGHDTLLVYLPGFKKEQLKVQVTSNRKLRIFGERPLVYNKRSRFSKEIQIPEKYETEKISAKFEGGILKIKHPKISRPVPAPALTQPKPQANQEKATQELQKPKNELKDSKNGKEKAAQENQELQKPKNELKDAKNGKEKAVQENQELQKPKNELKDAKNGKGKAVQENQELQKPKKELKDAKGQENLELRKPKKEFKNAKNGKENVVQENQELQTPKTEKKDEEMVAQAIPSKKTKENFAIEKKSDGKKKEMRNGIEKNSKLEQYKKIFGGLVTEIKKPRKSTNMIVAAGLLALLIGFCVKSTIKSQESEN